MIDTRDAQRVQSEQRTSDSAWAKPDVPAWSEVRGPVVPATGSPIETLVSKYVERAMLQAFAQRLPEDAMWFAEIMRIPDVWATGPTPEDSLEKLAAVLRAWLEWKIEDKDDDIPTIDGIDLTRL